MPRKTPASGKKKTSQVRTFRKNKKIYRSFAPIIPTYSIECKNYFALFGCWGKGCNPTSGQQLVANDINSDPKIEFIITAGDNIYEDKPNLEDFKEFFNTNVDMCYRKPMYSAIGNHDLEYIDEQIRHSNDIWHLPARNYMININDDIRLFVIDTNPLVEGIDTYRRHIIPMKAAEAEFEKSLQEFKSFVGDIVEEVTRTKKFTICVGHHPFITNRHKTNAKFVPLKPNDLSKEFQTILRVCDMYVCADEHNLQHVLFEDDEPRLNQFIIGGGGGSPDKTVVMDYPNETKFVHRYHGYGIFDVTSLSMSLRCLDEETNRFNDKYRFENKTIE
jgi:hypothetical protein